MRTLHAPRCGNQEASTPTIQRATPEGDPSVGFRPGQLCQVPGSTFPEKCAQALYTFADAAKQEGAPGPGSAAAEWSRAEETPQATAQDRMRELVRQNFRLALLNTMLSRVAGCQEIEAILDTVCSTLQDFSLKGRLALMLWDAQQPQTRQAEIFLPEPPRKDHARLSDELVQSGQQLCGRGFEEVRTRLFPGCKAHLDSGQDVLRYKLPLEESGGIFGLLLLDVAAESRPVMELGFLSCMVQQLTPQLSSAVAVSRLKALADYDGLTGLPNRRHFDKRLAEEVKRHQRQGRPLALMMLDLDDFKRINDAFGHQAGDALLQEKGRILASSIRETDVAARFGGEEFAILLPDTTERDAEVLARRLQRRNQEEGAASRELGVPSTFSIGIASLRSGERPDPAGLIRRADQALYAAKQDGKDTCRLFSEASPPGSGWSGAMPDPALSVP